MDFIDFFSLSASGDLSFTWAIIITQWAKKKNKRACFLVAFNKKNMHVYFPFSPTVHHQEKVNRYFSTFLNDSLCSILQWYIYLFYGIIQGLPTIDEVLRTVQRHLKMEGKGKWKGSEDAILVRSQNENKYLKKF